MTDKQPEALAVAGVCERSADNGSLEPLKLKRAAAELRRQHAEIQRLQDVNKELLEALSDSATSLETIGRLAGKTHYFGGDGERIPTYMEHHDEVRGYARSRATVARAVICKV